MLNENIEPKQPLFDGFADMPRDSTPKKSGRWKKDISLQTENIPSPIKCPEVRKKRILFNKENKRKRRVIVVLADREIITSASNQSEALFRALNKAKLSPGKIQEISNNPDSYRIMEEVER